jgi:hypothetical protein
MPMLGARGGYCRRGQTRVGRGIDGTWHGPDLGRPIPAPLARCADLLGVDVAFIQEAGANFEPYLRADGHRSGA